MTKLQETLEVFQVCIKSRHGCKHESSAVVMHLREENIDIHTYIHTVCTFLQVVTYFALTCDVSFRWASQTIGKQFGTISNISKL